MDIKEDLFHKKKIYTLLAVNSGPTHRKDVLCHLSTKIVLQDLKYILSVGDNTGLLVFVVVSVFVFRGEGRAGKKPHPNSSHFNLFDREER